jgi:hypothetical protein
MSQGMHTFMRNGLIVLDQGLNGGDLPSATNQMAFSLARVSCISSVDFVNAMSDLTDAADSLPEPLQDYRHRTIQMWRQKVTGEHQFLKASLSGQAKEWNSKFFRATSWGAVKQAFNLFEPDDPEEFFRKRMRMQRETTEKEDDSDIKDNLLVFYEKVIQEIIAEANSHPEIIVAAQGVRTVIQRKKLMKFAGIMFETLMTVPLNVINDLFSDMKSLTGKMQMIEQ